ncbi:MAG TPA: alkaline phosphatase family protein [Chthoniobacterales bacterium]|nr:alkaline phosphatase family protein [Chthoniobacterales bacterium]
MESSTCTPEERRRTILLILVMLVPLGLSVIFIYSAQPNAISHGSTPAQKKSTQSTANCRLILVIVDSLRRQAVDELMPNLKALAQRPGSTFLDVHTAGGNMSLPCIQTLLEGRESPYASAIHNFTGQHTSNNSLPAAAARAGLNPALIADFIILGLYGQYGAITVNRPDLAQSELGCDLAAIDKAIDVLSYKSVRLIILHVGGTDAVAHRWGPGHPQYQRHFRAVDAKLSELIAKLDKQNDYLIITGDHGHNERGNHVPWSVAIFAGGTYPQLFTALGPLGQLQQVDMLFFMAFPYDLPLPIDYEGRYFGIETPVDPAVTTPEIQRRLDAFRNTQAEALNVSVDDLQAAIAKKRAQARSITINVFQRSLPVLVLFLTWLTVAFRTNNSPKAPMWPLLALPIPAIALWLCAPPIVAAALGLLIGISLLVWAITASEIRRLCFLFVLIAAAAWAGFYPDRSQWIFWHHPLMAVLGVGTVIVLLGEHDLHAWPAAFCAVSMFVLPSGGFKTPLGPYILDAWLLGAGVVLLGLIATRRFRQIRFTTRAWISLCVLLIAGKLLRGQRPDIGRMHNVVIDWLNRHSVAGPVISIILYVGCACYLVWIVRRRSARIMMAATLLILPLYSCWFARLPFVILAVASVVPVFLASWTTIFEIPGPLKDKSVIAQERSGLFLATALVMIFWTIFQGFFIQEIDFSFALKYLPEKVSGLAEMAFCFPLTFVKYALPVVLVVSTYVGLRGWITASQAVIAALIFCNLKLATLLVQILIGPLGTQQKFYELAMSDFVFVSQLELIVAVTYLGLVLSAPVREEAMMREI